VTDEVGSTAATRARAPEERGKRADEIAVLAGARGPLAEVVALARRAGVKVSFRTREQLTAIAAPPSSGARRARGVGEYADLRGCSSPEAAW